MEDTFFYPTASILTKPLSDPQLRYVYDFTDCFAACVQKHIYCIWRLDRIDNSRNMTNSLGTATIIFSAAVSLTALSYTLHVFTFAGCVKNELFCSYFGEWFHPVMFEALSAVYKKKKVWEKDDYRENKVARQTDRKTAYLLWIRRWTTWITGCLNESNMLQPEKKRKEKRE